MSLRMDMNVNHEAIVARINHLSSADKDNSHCYESFYRKMCKVIDSQYRNEGPVGIEVNEEDVKEDGLVFK